MAHTFTITPWASQLQTFKVKLYVMVCTVFFEASPLQKVMLTLSNAFVLVLLAFVLARMLPQMEGFVTSGLAKSIGVSNFSKV